MLVQMRVEERRGVECLKGDTFFFRKGRAKERSAVKCALHFLLPSLYVCVL